MIEKIIDYINRHFTGSHLLILLGALIVFIGLIIVVVALYKKYVHELKQNIINSNYYKFLKVDLLNKNIYMFSKKDLKDAKEISLPDFLSQFDEDNQKIINRWFLSQLSKKKIEQNYKEITNYSKRKKSYSKDIFVCRQIDYTTHILFIDYYSSNNRTNQQYIKVDYEIERCFFKLKKSSITTIGTIFFFSTIDGNLPVTSDPIYRQQIVDIVLKYTNKNNFLALLKNDEICLISLNDYAEEEKRYEILNSMRNDICSFFSINNFSNQSFNIALYKNIGEKINFNDCLKKVRSLQNYLLDNYQYIPTISFYYDDGEYNCKNKTQDNDKIKKAILKDEFILSITPFLTAKKPSIPFYKITYKPLDNSLLSNKYSSINDIFNSPLKQDYINSLTKKIDEAYSRISKNISNAILIDIPLKAINYFINNSSLISKYKVIFNISNSELENQTNDDYIEVLTNAKSLGYKICVNMDCITNPKENVLRLMDFAFFNEKCITKRPFNANFFLQTNLFKLFNQNKIIIIAESIDDWQALETLISGKVGIFSSKCFELNYDLTATVSKKISSKIDNIYKKYY